MAKYTVTVSKSSGAVVTTQTAAIVVNADSDAAARRLALEQLADDASEIAWKATTAAPTTAPEPAHITTVVAD